MYELQCELDRKINYFCVFFYKACFKYRISLLHNNCLYIFMIRLIRLIEFCYNYELRKINYFSTEKRICV